MGVIGVPEIGQRETLPDLFVRFAVQLSGLLGSLGFDVVQTDPKQICRSSKFILIVEGQSIPRISVAEIFEIKPKI